MPAAKYPDYAKYQKDYRDSHPEKILAQRLRYYARFLIKNGYMVLTPEEWKAAGGGPEQEGNDK